MPGHPHPLTLSEVVWAAPNARLPFGRPPAPLRHSGSPEVAFFRRGNPSRMWPERAATFRVAVLLFRSSDVIWAADGDGGHWLAIATDPAENGPAWRSPDQPSRYAAAPNPADAEELFWTTAYRCLRSTCARTSDTSKRATILESLARDVRRCDAGWGTFRRRTFRYLCSSKNGDYFTVRLWVTEGSGGGGHAERGDTSTGDRVAPTTGMPPLNCDSSELVSIGEPLYVVDPRITANRTFGSIQEAQGWVRSLGIARPEEVAGLVLRTR